MEIKARNELNTKAHYDCNEYKTSKINKGSAIFEVMVFMGNNLPHHLY